MADSRKKADVVIIGLGGIVGASVAHHLIERGWKNIIGIDKSGVPTDIGSTAHASDFCFNTMHDQMTIFTTKYSIDFFEKRGRYERIGGLEVARDAACLVVERLHARREPVDAPRVPLFRHGERVARRLFRALEELFEGRRLGRRGQNDEGRRHRVVGRGLDALAQVARVLVHLGYRDQLEPFDLDRARVDRPEERRLLLLLALLLLFARWPAAGNAKEIELTAQLCELRTQSEALAALLAHKEEGDDEENDSISTEGDDREHLIVPPDGACIPKDSYVSAQGVEPLLLAALL